MSTTKHFNILQHRVPCQHIRHYARGTSEEEDELHLAVNQYTPLAKKNQRGTGITIVSCHANGAPKELYEPLWDALHEYCQKSGRTHILNIFIADIANQGQSGRWNEEKLGNEPSWYDDARDCLCMVNHLRKDMKQPILAFGHSMGGVVLMNAALMHPRLFASLTVFEATVYKTPRQTTSLGACPILFRKDQWPSRAAAAQALQTHPVYKTWDPAVLALFIQHGLRDLPTSEHPVPSSSDTPVTLSTTKDQEVSTYTRAAFPPSRTTPLSAFSPSPSSHPDIGLRHWRHPEEPFYRPEMTLTYAQLPHLRPPCLYLYGSDTTFLLGDAQRRERTEITGSGIGGSGGVAAGRVAMRVVNEGGHFLPLEAPRELAMEVLGPHFDGEVERWMCERREEREDWGKMEVGERGKVSEDFKWWMRVENNPRKVKRESRVKL